MINHYENPDLFHTHVYNIKPGMYLIVEEQPAKVISALKDWNEFTVVVTAQTKSNEEFKITFSASAIVACLPEDFLKELTE